MPAKRWILTGQVQGVGYRPFVYRLAKSHGLQGWVLNRGDSVEVVGLGAADKLEQFSQSLVNEAPQIAAPVVKSVESIPAPSCEEFTILPSSETHGKVNHVPVDYFTCKDCLKELQDPADRRYQYPFINCTQCGPRYTLINKLPYDRPNTTMRNFPLCRDCQAEYEDPGNRRFHAEPVACPVCGPRVWLSVDGGKDNFQGNWLEAVVDLLREGKIVATKGIGGYHLLCDAAQDGAVARLRKRKARPHKPLAVMFPAPEEAPLIHVNRAVEVSKEAARQLLTPARPIVLCPLLTGGSAVCEQVAPGLNELGVMLPYSPLHHLLLNGYGGPLVATSGNVSGEPVLTDPVDAEQRLGDIADAFLHHDRPIQRPADDSVMRIIAGQARTIRAGRGKSPMEFKLPFELPEPVIGLGGHMKNTVALAWDNRVVMSPHIGDMGSPRSLEVFEQVVADLQELYQVNASRLLCDAHPGYVTHQWARRQSLPVSVVYHHRAHASALFAESPCEDPVLVFTWDGVGYGEDGTLWGGEAFVGRPGAWRRYASFRPFRLPGGEKAGREPWRSAAALCWETGQEYESGLADPLLHQAWSNRINAPVTSAAGRLFDAAAAMLDLCSTASFEGQGPMMLEAVSTNSGKGISLPAEQDDSGCWLYDWSPLIPMLKDNTRSVGERAAAFHLSLEAVMCDLVLRAREELAVNRVGMTGGVFQNKRLREEGAGQLESLGFECIQEQQLPVNDGGLCVGQVREYAATLLGM